MTGCWHGYLSEARCKWFAYGPANATVTPSSLASLKSRMVLPFSCQLTQVVLEKRSLNGCSIVYMQHSKRNILQPGSTSSFRLHIISFFIQLFWNRIFDDKHVFLWAGCLPYHPNNNIKALNGTQSTNPNQWPGLILSSSTWNVTSAGWHVTLCDLIWHVSSCSSEACSQTVISGYFTTEFLTERVILLLCQLCDATAYRITHSFQCTFYVR